MAAHGTRARYVADCRCEACRWAEAVYQKKRRLDRLAGITRMVDATGTKRRIRALMRLGWPLAWLDAEYGCNPGALSHLANNSSVVLAGTAKRVAVMYERLCMTLPPTETSSQRMVVNRTRALAERHRWAPPLAWDDDTIDDPLARPRYGSTSRGIDYDEAVVLRMVDSGERCRQTLSHLEAAEVVRRLRARGLSPKQIENDYGLKPERYPQGRSA